MPNNRLFKPVLIVLAGPNGSGKTTVAKELLRHPWSAGTRHVNPDEIAQREFGGWNNDEAILLAARRADEIREACLAKRQGLIFETVLSTSRKYDFIQQAKEAGYFIRLFFVATDDPTINARRVVRRVKEEGHDVPGEKIFSRYPKSIALGAAVARIVDRAYFLDNSVDERDAKMIFRVADGKLKSLYTAEPPRWAWIVAKSILLPPPKTLKIHIRQITRELGAKEK